MQSCRITVRSGPTPPIMIDPPWNGRCRLTGSPHSHCCMDGALVMLDHHQVLPVERATKADRQIHHLFLSNSAVQLREKGGNVSRRILSIHKVTRYVCSAGWDAVGQSSVWGIGVPAAASARTGLRRHLFSARRSTHTPSNVRIKPAISSQEFEPQHCC